MDMSSKTLVEHRLEIPQMPDANISMQLGKLNKTRLKQQPHAVFETSLLVILIYFL